MEVAWAAGAFHGFVSSDAAEPEVVAVEGGAVDAGVEAGGFRVQRLPELPPLCSGCLPPHDVQMCLKRQLSFLHRPRLYLKQTLVPDGDERTRVERSLVASRRFP
eukprot:COSAG02_NODE_6042_length_3848_cov_3.936783_3_plen_104_part_01